MVARIFVKGTLVMIILPSVSHDTGIKTWRIPHAIVDVHAVWYGGECQKNQMV